jgi:hypothetical protein
VLISGVNFREPFSGFVTISVVHFKSLTVFTMVGLLKRLTAAYTATRALYLVSQTRPPS